MGSTVDSQNVFLFWEGREVLHARHFAAVNSVLHHHPRAKVAIYSNSLRAAPVEEAYRVAGLDVSVQRYNCTEMSVGLPGASLGRLLQKVIDAVFEASGSATPVPKYHAGPVPNKTTWTAEGRRVSGHKAFLTLLSEWMRYFLVYRHGGLYLDFDMLVLQPMLGHLPNTVGVDHITGEADRQGHEGFACMERNGRPTADAHGHKFACLCNCLLLLERGHPLLERALNLSQQFVDTAVAHRSWGMMRHYEVMTRVLYAAAGGMLRPAGGAAPVPIVSTFQQMDTFNFSCQVVASPHAASMNLP